jgi:hypothetical protein
MKNRVIGFEFGLLVVCLLGYARYESTHRVVVDESIFREDFENDKKVINELLDKKVVEYKEDEDYIVIKEKFVIDREIDFSIRNKQFNIVGDNATSYFNLRFDILVDKHIFWDKLIVEIDGNVKEYDMTKYERMDLRQEEFYEIREGYKEYYFLEVKDIFGMSDLDEILGCDEIMFSMSGKGGYYDGEIKGGELRKVKEMITLYRLIDKNKYFVGLDKLTKD